MTFGFLGSKTPSTGGRHRIGRRKASCQTVFAEVFAERFALVFQGFSLISEKTDVQITATGHYVFSLYTGRRFRFRVPDQPNARQPVYGAFRSRGVPSHPGANRPANRTLGTSTATYAGMRSDPSSGDPLRVANSSPHLPRDGRQVAVPHRHEATTMNLYSEPRRRCRPSDGLPAALEPCRRVVNRDQVRRVASRHRRLITCRDPRHTIEVAQPHRDEPVIHHVDAKPARPDPPASGGS